MPWHQPGFVRETNPAHECEALGLRIVDESLDNEVAAGSDPTSRLPVPAAARRDL
jgi:hypothetical protein